MNKILLIVGLLLLIACNNNKQQTPVTKSKKTTWQLSESTKICRQEDWFDESGNIIKSINYGNRANDTLSIINYYYSDDLLIEQLRIKPDGKVMDKTIHLYTLGSLTGEIFVVGTDTLTTKYFSYYDNGSLKRTATVYNMEKNNPVTSVTYLDQYGNVEKIYNQIYEDSTKIVISRYEMQSYTNTYNTSGKLEKSIGTMLFGYYESPDTLSVTTFQYDQFGNLIQQLNSKKTGIGQPDSIVYQYNSTNMLMQKIAYSTAKQKNEVVAIIDTTSYKYDSNKRLINEYSYLKKTGFEYSYK
ncbi:MAG: hypothetical protein WBP31_10460 [Chitinophagales bacterium]|nr:hypothetical protein [Bacteroidota bacterium]MBL0279291.1 hypothetical protein [Bacteroidota bacterium]MBP8249743.1 hypothetical protein [Chitinophagales bacterium]MBP9879826.1 hypothetical protein [Chitinophagales bacterium]